jgi:hypothetical protein
MAAGTSLPENWVLTVPSPDQGRDDQQQGAQQEQSCEGNGDVKAPLADALGRYAQRADGAAEAGILRLREADGKKDDFSFIAEAETYPAKFVRCRKRGLAIYIP